jgi:hypothetical protein
LRACGNRAPNIPTPRPGLFLDEEPPALSGASLAIRAWHVPDNQE